MRTITIKADSNIKSVKSAEDAARAAIRDTSGELTLVGWYDAANGTGGPLEVCGDEPATCVEDYAASHEADYHVKVNGGDYTFYFARIPDDVATMQRKAVLQRHADLPEGRYDNIQGG